MDEDHAILHVHFNLVGQPALLDEGLWDPDAARVADANECRFHACNVPTL
jgi:hypothetical protein